jgi:cytochrome P450
VARPPTLPGKPFLGSLLDVRNDRIGTFMRAAQLGDVVHIHFPSQESVLLSHPDHVRRVFVDDHRLFGKQTRGYDALRLGLGNGLVTSEGSFWRRQRRIAQPAFHRRRIAGFGEKMTTATLDMLERWARPAQLGQAIDIDSEMMALTFRIVGECLMSTDISSDADSVGDAVTTLLNQVTDRITKPFQLPLHVPTPSNKRLQRALEVLDELVLGIIAKRRASDEEHDDLLDMLMRTEDAETGERMTDRQLRDEIITIVLAGHETTANAISWALYLLSKVPSAATELREELSRELPGQRVPTADDLPRLAFTEAVVKESMRLFPPVWLVARSVEETVELGGYTIPKGHVVFISPYVMHHDRRFFPNPEGFEPARFLGEAAKAIPKHAYIPFIAGPRQCIGNTFAIMEAQLIMATMLSRYELHLVAGQEIVASPTVTLRPEHGIKMHIEPCAAPSERPAPAGDAAR